MALREEAALVTLSLPSAYSFWASMMMRVLLDGEAEEGETPTIWRKDWGAIIGCCSGGVVGKMIEVCTSATGVDILGI